MHGGYDRDYPKKGAGDSIKVDEYGDGEMKSDDSMRAKGGGTSELSGPTTSPRSYPKGTRLNTSSERLNPQKVAVTKIYVGGID